MTPTSATATYDSSITLPTPTRTGYTFSGWYNGSTKYTTGTWKTAGDTTLTAKWTARTDIAYVVHHYQQNITDNEYTLFETQNLKGTADASIKPATNSYTGFTAPTKQTVTVKPDGSLVVNYYYTRNSYSITFITNGGDTIAKITQKYQSALSVPDATRNGYTFGGWFTNATLTTSYTKPTTMPATSRTVYAYWAEENKPSDFTYSGSSAITVSAYKGTSTTMWIPSYIGGKAVTTIPAAAFENLSSLEKVVIPNTVNSIGEGALKGCTNINEITIPFVGQTETSTDNNSVFGYIFGMVRTMGYSTTKGKTSECNTTDQGYESYYDYGFAIPKSIRIVSITKQTAIPAHAFYNCDLLEEINIPQDALTIGEYAFYNCTNVVAYNRNAENYSVLPTSIIEIPAHAFENNLSLNKVILSSAIVSIDNYAFSGCSNLSACVTNGVSTTLEHIGDYAFSGCGSIISYFAAEDYILNIPNGVIEIGPRAFESNKLLTKIIVPNTVNKIGEGTFYGCSSIAEIQLPFVGDSETATGNTSVFGYIFGMVRTMGYSTTKGKTSECNITDQGYESYYDYGFAIPKSIRIVSITKQTAIPAHAFYNCDLLEKINIPENTDTIGEYAFYNCTNVIGYNMDANNVSVLPTTLTSIADYTFANNSSLSKVIISGGVISIGKYAFYECTSLQECKSTCAEMALSNIDEYAFSGCAMLANCFYGDETELIIPNGVLSIGTRAFEKNKLFTKIVVPNTVTKIGEGAFNGCLSVVNISIPFVGSSESATGNYAVLGYIFGLVKTSGVSTTRGTTSECNTTDQGDVSSYKYGFAIPRSLRSVTITKQTSLPNNSFKNCDLIEEIIISGETTSIGENAFHNCATMKNIYIPNTVETIGEYAFKGCTALTINCGASSQPDDWDYNWNPSNCTVAWGK